MLNNRNIVLIDIKLPKDLLLNTFYHELGHIRLKHLLDYEEESREQAIAMGKVHYAELEANRFWI